MFHIYTVYTIYDENVHLLNALDFWTLPRTTVIVEKSLIAGTERFLNAALSSTLARRVEC